MSAPSAQPAPPSSDAQEVRNAVLGCLITLGGMAVLLFAIYFVFWLSLSAMAR